jgi:hypothetical protein
MTPAERIRHLARRGTLGAIVLPALISIVGASIVGASIVGATPAGPQPNGALPAPVVADVLQQGLTPTAPPQQPCAGPLVDDFSSGPYHAEVHSGVPDPSTQTGSMLGGQRLTRFFVPGAPTNPNNNPYDLPSTLDILPNQSSILVVSTPYLAFHGLHVFYGVGTALDANLTCHDRFRVHFAASDVGLNINMQVVAANTNNQVAGCGKNVPGQTTGGGFDVDFPFNCFANNTGTPTDFRHITQIRLIVQSGSAIAGNDYAIAKIEAAGTGAPPSTPTAQSTPTPTRRPTSTPCPLIICLPL